MKYGLVGALNVLLFFAIYNGLRLLDVNTLGSRAPAFFVTTLISFRLNKSWSFRDTRTHAVVRQYLAFVAFTLAGFGLQTGLFNLFRIPLKRYGLLGENIALVAALPFSVLWNFTGYRYVVFRTGFRAPDSS